jgi:hypothetical protein
MSSGMAEKKRGRAGMDSVKWVTRPMFRTLRGPQRELTSAIFPPQITNISL